MSLKSYIKEKLNAVNVGIFLICLIPIIFISFYVFSNYADSNLVFYIGLYVCGVLTFIPLWILTGFLLLIINPEKYKEYEMKKLRKQKEEERRTYLLIFLSFLMMQLKDFKNN